MPYRHGVLAFAPSIALSLAVIGSAACGKVRDPAPSSIGDPLWDNTTPLIPQLRSRSDFFADMPTSTGDVENALLVCRVVVDKTALESLPDIDQTPELAITLRLPGQPPADAYAARERWRMVGSVPGVTLRRGDRVRVHVWDSDSFSRGETIEQLELEFNGTFPIHGKSDKTEVSCRALAGGALDARLADAVAMANESIASARRSFHFDLEAPEQGFPEQAVRAARKRVAHAAAHVGWSDPRIRALVSAEAALHTEWKRYLVSQLEPRIEALPPANVAQTHRGLSARAELICARSDIEATAREIWPNDWQRVAESTHCFAAASVAADSKATSYSLAHARALLAGIDGEVRELRPLTLRQGQNVGYQLSAEAGAEVTYLFSLQQWDVDQAPVSAARKALYFHRAPAEGMLLAIE